MTGSSSTSNAVVRALDDDSARWGIARPIAWTLLIVPLLFMGAIMIVGVVDAGLFHWFVDEDHIVEWVQFFAILIARSRSPSPPSGPAGRGATGSRRSISSSRSGRSWRPARRSPGASACSGSPRPRRSRTSTTRPSRTSTTSRSSSDCSTSARCSPASMGCCSRCSGCAPAFKTRVGRWLDPLLVPPLCLVVLFFLPFAYRAIRFVFLPDAGDRITELGEVPELTFYLGVMVMGIATTGVWAGARAARRRARHRPIRRPPARPRPPRPRPRSPASGGRRTHRAPRARPDPSAARPTRRGAASRSRSPARSRFGRRPPATSRSCASRTGAADRTRSRTARACGLEPKKWPPGPDLGDRVEAEGRLVDLEGHEDLGHHLEDLGVDDQLLERRGQAALEPAGALVEQVHPAHDRAPHRHLGLVGRLGIDDARGRRVRRPPRQAIAARQLARRERRLDVLWRAERRRAGAHVDVRGEPAVDHRRPGSDELGERDHEQRLGVLLGERAGEGHRGHRAGQRERGRHHRLTVEGHLDEAVGHRSVEPERRVRVDDRHDARATDAARRDRSHG